MNSTLQAGPAILLGYTYALQIELSAGLIVEDARFTGQLRSTVASDAVLATLTSDGNELVRISDTVLEIRISAADTAQMSVGSVVLDIVRTDLEPPAHLGVFLEIPVMLPVTRGL